MSEAEKECCNCEYHLTEKANKKIKELESKLATAREVLKELETEYLETAPEYYRWSLSRIGIALSKLGEK